MEKSEFDKSFITQNVLINLWRRYTLLKKDHAVCVYKIRKVRDVFVTAALPRIGDVYNPFIIRKRMRCNIISMYTQVALRGGGWWNYHFEICIS